MQPFLEMTLATVFYFYLATLPLSSMVNWWRVDWHGEIIRPVALQYIEILTRYWRFVEFQGFVELFQGKYLFVKINENNI